MQRYLDDEPVQACPPSAGYRLRKFVRRNRGPVLAAGLILLLLVGGIVGTTIGLMRARKRLAQVEKGIEILGSIFEDLDPRAEEKEGRPLRAILGDRLDRAAAELEGEAVGDPLVVAGLQDRLGRTYLPGPRREGGGAVREGPRDPPGRPGRDDPLTLATGRNLALALDAAGKPSEAITLLERVRDAQVRTLGADHPDTLATLNDLALMYWRLGKMDEAIALLEQVRDARVKQLGAEDPLTLATLESMASVYMAPGGDRGHRAAREGAGRPGEDTRARPSRHHRDVEQPGVRLSDGREDAGGRRPVRGGAGRDRAATRGGSSADPRHPR